MANRFWVGGTGTWDGSSTANWSATSGGASGASAPVAADAVFFDSNSGTGTCTTAAGATCTSATLNTSTLGLTLGDNLTMSGLFTLTLGTLSLGSSTLSCLRFSSDNANARSVAFGTGTIELTGNGVQVLVMNNATNFTYTGTPNINATYSGSTGTRTINFGSGGGATETNALNLNITAGTDIVTFQSTGTAYKNLNFTGFAGSLTFGTFFVYGNLTISSGMTLPSTTSGLSFRATSGTQQITTNGQTLDFPVTQNAPGATLQLQDNLTMGSTRTFTLTAGTLDLTGNSGNWTLSTGLFSSSNSNTRSIAFGTGNITVIGVGFVWLTSTPTNFSYTGTPTVNVSNNSATAATVSTGSMTAAQALNFNFTTGTYALTEFTTTSVYRSVNFTGFAGTIANNARIIHGSLTLAAGMTLTAGTNTTTFVSTSAGNTITSAGKTIDFPLTFDGVGGVWTCQDALTLGSTRALTMTNGTLNLKAGATSTVGSFVTTGTNQKYLGSSTPGTQATISDASGVNSVSFLTIQDSVATGGADWEAYASNGNIDAGNNLNWDFGATPILGTEYEYKLRSFTQPRRF